MLGAKGRQTPVQRTLPGHQRLVVAMQRMQRRAHARLACVAPLKLMRIGVSAAETGQRPLIRLQCVGIAVESEQDATSVALHGRNVGVLRSQTGLRGLERSLEHDGGLVVAPEPVLRQAQRMLNLCMIICASFACTQR